MPPSDLPDPVAPRRLPTAEDFPVSGPFSLAAPVPRFGARAVDLAIVLAPALFVIAVASSAVGGQLRLEVPVWLAPALLAFAVAYETLGVAVTQRTIGKALFGLRVVRYTDGGRPTFGQAVLRALVPWWVMALPLGPFSIAAVLAIYGTGVSGSLHRGWPDTAGGTLVLSTR